MSSFSGRALERKVRFGLEAGEGSYKGGIHGFQKATEVRSFLPFFPVYSLCSALVGVSPEAGSAFIVYRDF